MKNYHINKNSEVVECNNQNCKLKHYHDFDEAQKDVMQIMLKEFSIIPDVVYVYNIPDSEIMNYFSHNHSEMYVASKAYEGSTIIPYVALGMNDNDESIYHCLYEKDGFYYDINGVIATNESELEDYLVDFYGLTKVYTLVHPEKSIEMMESILGFHLFWDTTLENLTTKATNELFGLREDEVDKGRAMIYLIKEIEQEVKLNK